MVLIPSLMSASLSDTVVIRTFGKPVAKRTFGIVAITPSFRDCERWENAGADKADTKNIQSAIERSLRTAIARRRWLWPTDTMGLIFRIRLAGY